MSEIQVGEYIRTNKGNIGKFKYYAKDDDTIVYFKNGLGFTCIKQDDIKIHSLNIIDLIETGDYVNGMQILKIEKRQIVKPYVTVALVYKAKDCEYWINLNEKTIQTIVTKEQFSSMEYKLEVN